MVEFPVYIEDTDCFGVVFYANYFRYFQRAAAAARSSLPGLLRPPDGSPEPALALVAIEQARFAAPARLGDAVEISTQVRPGPQPMLRLSQVAQVAGAVCVSADALYVPVTADSVIRMQPPPPLDQAASLSLSIAAFEDELTGPPPPWLPAGSQCMSAFDVLRWLERGRTMSIGGASGLEALQATGVLVVVARIDAFALDLGAAAAACLGGGARALEARTAVSLQSRGRRVVFDQQILDTRSGASRPLAWGRITCVCADAVTKKLITVPERLIAQLESVGLTREG